MYLKATVLILNLSDTKYQLDCRQVQRQKHFMQEQEKVPLLNCEYWLISNDDDGISKWCICTNIASGENSSLCMCVLWDNIEKKTTIYHRHGAPANTRFHWDILYYSGYTSCHILSTYTSSSIHLIRCTHLTKFNLSRKTWTPQIYQILFLPKSVMYPVNILILFAINIYITEHLLDFSHIRAL